MLRLSVSGDRWAAPYPAADIIRLGDRRGARLDLACDWPNDVAWAGESLIVVTAHGTVLLFDGIGQLLG